MFTEFLFAPRVGRHGLVSLGLALLAAAALFSSTTSGAAQPRQPEAQPEAKTATAPSGDPSPLLAKLDSGELKNGTNLKQGLPAVKPEHVFASPDAAGKQWAVDVYVHNRKWLVVYSRDDIAFAALHWELWNSENDKRVRVYFCDEKLMAEYIALKSKTTEEPTEYQLKAKKSTTSYYDPARLIAKLETGEIVNGTDYSKISLKQKPLNWFVSYDADGKQWSVAFCRKWLDEKVAAMIFLREDIAFAAMYWDMRKQQDRVFFCDQKVMEEYIELKVVVEPEEKAKGRAPAR